MWAVFTFEVKFNLSEGCLDFVAVGGIKLSELLRSFVFAGGLIYVDCKRFGLCGCFRLCERF